MSRSITGRRADCMEYDIIDDRAAAGSRHDQSVNSARDLDSMSHEKWGG